MTSFFRFLSKRAKSSSDANRLKHTKLNGCEDLKEALDSLNNNNNNNRLNNNLKLTTNNNNNNANGGLTSKTNNNLNSTNVKSNNSKFLSFKSLHKYAYGKSNDDQQASNQNTKDKIECAVIFLDGSDARFFIEKKANADKLYEKVYYHLDLIETDYFGLQYTDTHNVQHWLDPSKCIRKQCKIGPPFTFFFKVKFYTAEPNNLKEEITRYFYFLQLKSDIRSGKLPCTQQLQIELSALILQEELGDYDSNQHSIETVSEFRFVPDQQQNEELEESILKQYKTKCVGLTPAEAELMYLSKAKWLEMYGVDMHQVFGRDQNEYKLGLTPSGILVFEGEQKIGLFYWPKIEKVTFSKKKFTIIVTEDDDRGFKQEHTFIFHLIDEKACKHLWKCAVEYHAFFRLRTAPKQVNGVLSGFIRRGSRFRGPQRTEFQTTNLSLSTRRSVQFERRPSQRFSRRASYAIKRKLQEQQKLRDQSSNTAAVAAATTAVTSNVHHTAATNESVTVTSSIADAAHSKAINDVNCKVADESSKLIEIDSIKPVAIAAAAVSIKEEAENAQAKLKQIEIEGEKPHKPQMQPPPVPARQRINVPVVTTTASNDSVASTPTPPPLPPMPTSVKQAHGIPQNHGNCCKLQQSNGGNEHDIKCNLLKAQQINCKKSELASSNSCVAATTSLTATSASCSNSCGCETCEKELKAKSGNKIIHDDEPEVKNIDVVILDKNVEHNSDDKSKLIDKEMISSITKPVKHGLQVASSPVDLNECNSSKTSDTDLLIQPPKSSVRTRTPSPALMLPQSIAPVSSSSTTTTTTTTCVQSSYLKESSFISPPVTLHQNETSSSTTTTSIDVSSLSTQQAQVVITRTQSIYNDRSATAAILHINQNTKSSHSNATASQLAAGRRTIANTQASYRPITTEL